MPKILAISGMIVAGLILLFFGFPVFDQRRPVGLYELVDLPRSRVIGRGAHSQSTAPAIRRTPS
jgi:uncharacterized membrane protein YGL010W